MTSKEQTRRLASSLWVPGLLLLWASTIFVSSCFFIERSQFIRFVAKYLPAGIVRSDWAWLWLVAGLVIVKTYHATEYFVLFSLIFLTAERRSTWPLRLRLALAFTLGLLFAASDEWHQTFVEGAAGLSSTSVSTR